MSVNRADEELAYKADNVSSKQWCGNYSDGKRIWEHNDVSDQENFKCHLSSRQKLQEIQGVTEVCWNGEKTWC